MAGKPVNNRSVSFSNSLPHPALSVRASPPSSTFTVPSGWTDAILAQTLRRRTISETSNPPIIVRANTRTHT